MSINTSNTIIGEIEDSRILQSVRILLIKCFILEAGKVSNFSMGGTRYVQTIYNQINNSIETDITSS